jgi:hypothetical protein
MNSSAEVYFSYNERLINKNSRKDTDAFANGWVHVTGTVKILLDVIKSGMAYSVWFRDGIRKTENFVGSNLVSIDVDGANQIDIAIAHEFSQKHLTALYTTCSHTEQEHRFRLMFRLERVIESSEDYRNILRALRIMYSGDRAAAEPARLFYGNDQAQAQSWDRFIPNNVIDHLMKLNLEPEWDNKNHQQDRASSRSEAKIPLDMTLRTSKGQQVRFGNVADRTSIYCPHHHDQTASAFVGINHYGSRFIHCVACQTTWFQVNPLFDFEPAIKLDFVATLRSVKSMSQQELQDQLAKLPVDVKASDVHEANIVFMNQKHVAIESIQPGLTLIKSPKGSGKTHSLTSVIRNIFFRNYGLTLDEFETEYDDEGPPTTWETGKTVLLVGHRQALIRSMCQRLDLNCYLDEKDRSPNGSQRDFRKRFGVCLDSIKKITSLESPIHRYDLVIIDEVEQVLAHLMASTSRDGAGFLDTIGRIVGNAESVIAMDADLGWTSFLTLNSMRNKSLDGRIKRRNEIYINEYVAENRPIDIYDSKPQLIAQLMSDAQAGKKVFVSTNSKKQVNRLELAIKTKLPDVKLIAITSDNSSSTMVTEFVGDIKTEAKKYDVVISSPSLGTGIDITFSEDEEFYDSVYGIYEALINGHTEIDQQLARVRHPKSVKVWVSPRRFNFETHFDVIKSDLLCSSVIANTALDLAMPVADQVFADNSDFFRTAALILSSQRESKNQLKKNFIEYKQSQGWVPNFVSAPDDQVLGTEVLHLGKILEEQVYAERLLSSKPLSELEFLRMEDALQNEERLTADEFLSHQRMKLEIFYGSQIDLQMITDDKRWKLRKQFAAYNRLLDSKTISEYQSRTKFLPVDRLRKNLTVLADEQAVPYLLRGLLASTPIFFKNEVVTGVEFTSSDLKEFTRICLKLKSTIERQMDINVRTDITGKPVRQLGDLLGIIGIKTTKPRTEKTPTGGKTYFYMIDPESVHRMTDLIALEEQRKNPWEAINARYGFKTTQNWG